MPALRAVELHHHLAVDLLRSLHEARDPSRELLLIDAGDLDALAPVAGTGDEPHRAPGHGEDLGEEPDELRVRLAVDRLGRDGDLEGAGAHADDMALARARLREDGQDGEGIGHLKAVEAMIPRGVPAGRHDAPRTAR